MTKLQLKSQSIQTKLIALWAVSESGLGGFLHALKIPFSGLFLGGFAVIIITYLAYTSERPLRAIVKATLLVIIIKAIVSPHSPPMAYVAVLFQGIFGGITYSLFKVNRISAISFGVIALFESAFQKILTLTIIFGLGLWDSIEQFFDGLQAKIDADWISDIPLLFLVIYGLLYCIVGFLVGNLAYKIPQRVYENSRKLKNIDLLNDKAISSKKGGNSNNLPLIIGLLIFSSLVFFVSGSRDEAIYIVLRTLAVVVFLLFIIDPLFKYLMQKWVKNQRSSKKKTLNEIMSLMPLIRNNVGIAQRLSSSEKGIWKRGTSFIINWLSLTLYHSDKPKNEVIILSDAKHIGKTTTLENWIGSSTNIGGFLSPDIDGKRVFKEIGTNKVYPMEKEDGDLIIGKYRFDSQIFDFVENSILSLWESQRVETIVLDEIGPLEINKELGFFKLLQKLEANQNYDSPRLLLVVRDFCLNDFLNKFNFNNISILSLSSFQDRFITAD